jgi:hypothetical protein
MKFYSWLLLSAITTQAFGATTLKIPLFVEQGKKTVPMSQINAQYKLTGAQKLPEVLIVTKTSLDSARKIYWDVNEKVGNLSGDLNLASDFPGGNNFNGLRTCYTGTPAEAVSLAGQMADSIYSDQLGFWGWKYKKEIHMETDQGEEMDQEAVKTLNENSPIWKNWKGTDGSILIVSHEGDDGDDINAGIIVECK